MKKYNLHMSDIFKKFISLILFSFISFNAFAIETIEISGGGTKQINIAVMPYKETAADKTNSLMHQIIAADLDRKSTRLNSSH